MKQNCLDWNNHTIEIPKIKNVQFRNSKAPDWYKNRTKICSITVSKTPQEKYYVSILFEVKVKSQEKHFDNENQVIGLDFDCDDMYIDSNGQSALKDFGFKKRKQLHHKQLHHLQIQLATKHLEVWKCPKCGTIHQRDYNAAINIKNEAIRVLREPEESSEKSNRMSKDQNSLSSIEKLANLALECSRLGNAGNNL